MIQLQQVGVQFGKREILRHLDIDIPERGITAVMGPNGCGKTTLLRCIGGHLQPNIGQVLIDSEPVLNLSARRLAQKVAFVRQHPTTDFDFTAFETVMMGRNPYQHRLQNESQTDRDIVEQCMRQTNTWHLRHAHPTTMSGGELQRVMIARALAQQTPILLLDEPVSNLDIAHQLEIMRLLRQAEEKTVLIVIHDLNLALRFCDSLLLLHDGAVLYQGPIEQGLTSANILIAYGVKASLEDGYVKFDY